MAFSSYVFDASGNVLLTRRADHKITWPGVLTNSCCGHPCPVRAFLRLSFAGCPTSFRSPFPRSTCCFPASPTARSCPTARSQHELCPVYRALVGEEPTANPDEVGSVLWMPWKEFSDQVLSGELEISPWATEQLPQLAALGPDPLTWPVADPGSFPRPYAICRKAEGPREISRGPSAVV